jgi:hypothetical protein
MMTRTLGVSAAAAAAWAAALRNRKQRSDARAARK